MNRAPFWIVDAFVGEAFGRKLRGNPAAVVLLDEFESDDELQERADEFNLSETAFVVARGDLNFDLRWFTPRVEVDLCGHATLAAAFALLDAGHLQHGQTAQFQTRSGVLKALVEENRIELDFPVQRVEECEMPVGLQRALELGKNPVLFCGRANEDWLLRVDMTSLWVMQPRFEKLAKIHARGIIVTAPHSDDEADFSSRFFAPRVGINEDPATGSAHCALASFWAERLNKTKLKAVQVSPRGGLLELELRDGRVGIAGQCALRARGTLC